MEDEPSELSCMYNTVLTLQVVDSLASLESTLIGLERIPLFF